MSDFFQALSKLKSDNPSVGGNIDLVIYNPNLSKAGRDIIRQNYPQASSGDDTAIYDTIQIVEELQEDGNTHGLSADDIDLLNIIVDNFCGASIEF